jgi:polysaccharide export outer membrane protein
VRSVVRAVLATSLLLGAAGIAACSGPSSSLPPLPTADAATYRLGPGDQVRVITFQDEQLTGEFRVNDNGTLALPLLGSIQAAGLTTSELASSVAQELQRRNLFKDPSVSVEVVNYRPIFILGEVNRPGQYPYQPGMTVVSAVAIAGGFTYRAVEDQVSIVRNTSGKSVEGRAGRETTLRPGDVITVYERSF